MRAFEDWGGVVLRLALPEQLVCCYLCILGEHLNCKNTCFNNNLVYIYFDVFIY